MKRKADQEIQALPAQGRTTRSMSRRQRLEANLQRARVEEQERAIKQTPFEKILSIVVSNGFLYRFQCLNSIPCISKGCNDVWKDLKRMNAIPEKAVEVEFSEFSGSKFFWNEEYERVSPSTMLPPSYRVTKRLITSQAFLKNLFEKINDLKVRSRPSKKKRAEALSALPKWGEDIQIVKVITWGSCRCNDGGILLDFGKNVRSLIGKEKRKCFVPCQKYVRLRPDLTIWGGLTKRALQLYDGLPLLVGMPQLENGQEK